MNCLIVDDEPYARQLLETYVAKLTGLSLLPSCANAVQAFEVLRQQTVHLLFLDIQMPQITGIELLKSLHVKPRIIITTAYRDYAMDAYDLDVVDYLLKPIAFERFLRAVNKVFEVKPVAPLPSSHAAVGPGYAEAFTYVKTAREMVKIFLKDILYIESLRDYVRIKTATRDVIAYQKISYLEQMLPENYFLRVHRSYIVAMEQVTVFKPSSLKVGTVTIPIGRSFKTIVLNRFHQRDALVKRTH